MLVRFAGEWANDRRGTIFGKRVGDPPKSDAKHFIGCPACGGWIDWIAETLSYGTISALSEGSTTIDHGRRTSRADGQ
jgi:hypothetical protein